MWLCGLICLYTVCSECVCLIVCRTVCVFCRLSAGEFVGFVMSVPSRALQTIVSFSLSHLSALLVQ